MKSVDLVTETRFLRLSLINFFKANFVMFCSSCFSFHSFSLSLFNSIMFVFNSFQFS
jgi:hypothetical protein